MFSHSSTLDLISDATAAGYEVVMHVVMHVVMIPLTMCGPRVAARVAAGGHSVPADKLAARYERLWPNVAAAVPACHLTMFWDNSLDDGPVQVATYRYGLPDRPPLWPAWTPDAVAALR